MLHNLTKRIPFYIQIHRGCQKYYHRDVFQKKNFNSRRVSEMGARNVIPGIVRMKIHLSATWVQLSKNITESIRG